MSKRWMLALFIGLNLIPVSGWAGKRGEMKRQWIEIRTACKADAEKICNGKSRKDLMECLQVNRDKLSTECQAKLPTQEQILARVEELKVACKTDIDQFCKGKEHRELFACMHAHKDKLSEGCKAASHPH